jgi:hypothetical protein
MKEMTMINRILDQIERAAAREEDAEEQAFARGDISHAELNRRLRVIQRDARDEARAAEEEAVENSRDDWRF